MSERYVFSDEARDDLPEIWFHVFSFHESDGDADQKVRRPTVVRDLRFTALPPYAGCADLGLSQPNQTTARGRGTFAPPSIETRGQ